MNEHLVKRIDSLHIDAMKEKKPTTARTCLTGTAGGVMLCVALFRAAVRGHVVVGKHSGRLLALGLGLVRKVRKKALHRVNARIHGFPALDLCDGVKRHPGCLRDFLNLRKASGVKMLQKGVENRCHVLHLTGCGKPTQHISYRLR